MKKLRKHAKKALCVALSAAMLFTSTGMTVFAEESVQAEETQQEFQAEETSTDKASVEEEITEEVPVREETTEQEEAEEEDFVEEAEESTLTDKASEEDKVVDEEDADDRSTENTSAEDTSTEETASETGLTEEDTDAEETDSESDIASGAYKEDGNDITWVIDKDGKLTVEGTGDFSADVSESRAPWYESRFWIKSAKVKVTGMTNASYMFYECTALTEVDLSEFDVRNVTDMSYMFYRCYKLTNLNLDGFNTGNVTDMSYMFYMCGYIETLNLIGFETDKITSMSHMFDGCCGLLSLDLSGFHTENVRNMDHMFYDCMKLKKLDLRNFNTEKVTDTSYMFFNCENLVSLDVSNFKTEKVTNMKCMFSYCQRLLSVNLGCFNAENTKNMESIFEGCYDLTKIQTPYNISLSVNLLPDTLWYDSEGNLYTELPQNKSESVLLTKKSAIVQSGEYEDIKWSIDEDGKLFVEGTGDFATPSSPEENPDSNRAPWSRYSGLIKTAEIKVQGITDASYMFEGCSDLRSVDLSGFDTRNVINMQGMFSGCSELIELNLSSFDIKNVEDMSSMFANCDNLMELDLGGLNAENVSNMQNMFSGCYSLIELNLSGFNTKKVTNMEEMFNGCNRLTNLDLSGFHTENVTDMDNMFENCYSLTELDLSAFDVKNINGEDGSMNDFFSGAEALTMLCTPLNVSTSVKLPSGTWYDIDGNTYTELPMNKDISIWLAKDKKPVVISHITAIKKKTVYYCGETLNIDDIIVRYYGTDGSAKELAQTEYTTNVAEIDMNTEGEKTLTVTYNDMTVDIKLTVSKKVEGSASDERPNIEENGTVLFPKKIKDSYSAVYTGEKICPTMVVTYNYKDSNGKPKTQTLKLNVDYTVTYENNIDAVGAEEEKAATVTVKGIGEYQGTVTKKFSITPKSISKVTLSAVGDIRYEDIKNGERPKVTVMDGTKELVEDTDYTVSWTEGSEETTTVSTLTVKAVEGKPCNYTGVASKKPTFNILGKDAGDVLSIASDDIIVEWKNPDKIYTYNGKAQKPAVVVKDKEGKKVASNYYKVIYTNNVNAGTNTAEAYVVGVTKKGAGYYGRSKSLKFTIEPKSFSKVSASMKGTLPKFGTLSDIKTAISEAVVVKDGKTILSYEKDYTIDYSRIPSFDEIKSGVAYEITISPAGSGGNYKTETKEKTLKIKFGQLNLASKTAVVSLTIINVDDKKVTLTYNGRTLEQDKDYEVTSIKKEKNTELYTVKAKAKKGSDYKGSLTFKGVQALSLTLNEERITGKTGETVQLTTKVQCSTVEWESSNKSVATVTDEGLVSMVGSGMTVITASASVEQIKLTAQCQVIVEGEMKNYVTVTDFGAVPNDGGDDWDAFTKAFESLGRGEYEGCDTVYVPEGTYDIDVERGINMPANTKLCMNEDTVVQALKCDNKNNQIIGVYSSDVEISGGTIIGELRATGKDGESGMGIRIQNAQNVYIHDVTIKECRGDGIYIGGNGKGSTNVNIIDCTIADCSRNCLGIVSAHNVYVDNCTIMGAGSLFGGKAPRACILIEKNEGDDICTDIVIKNSTVDNKEVCSKQSEAYAFGSAWINWPDSPVIQGDRLTVENCTFKGKVANYSVTNAQFINCTFDGEKIFKQGTVVKNE